MLCRVADRFEVMLIGGPDPYLHDAPETLAWHAKLITVSASFAVSFELRFGDGGNPGSDGADAHPPRVPQNWRVR